MTCLNARVFHISVLTKYFLTTTLVGERDRMNICCSAMSRCDDIDDIDDDDIVAVT